MMQNQQARANMLASQMLPNEVTSEPVLQALEAVDRAAFVPEALKAVAYADDNLPLAGQRVMMKPFILARMLQLAAIEPHHHVLHIGAGRGYASALLRKLAAHVMAVECHHELAEAARNHLRDANVDVEVFISTLSLGYPLSAPYDVIFIEGAVQQIPSGLVDQLKEDGVLVAVQNVQQRLDAASGLGKAILARKIDGKLHRSIHFDASVPLLPGFEKKEEFTL